MVHVIDIVNVHAGLAYITLGRGVTGMSHYRHYERWARRETPPPPPPPIT